MYRVGKRNRAHAHGTYIRPLYLEVWKGAERQAEKLGVSLSQFVNHGLFVIMTGCEPSDSPLTGKTPMAEGRPVLNIGPDGKQREQHRSARVLVGFPTSARRRRRAG